MERLNELCKEKGISKRTLEKEAGLGNGSTSKWKEKKPNQASLQKLSDYFQVSISYLIGESDFRTEQDAIIGKRKQGFGCETTEKASFFSDDTKKLAEDYDALDAHGKHIVRSVIDIELERVKSVSIDSVHEERPKTKIIPLLGNSFAAGLAEPDFGNPWTDYSVPADSNADFAIKINGNSMEPYLKDGTIALCKKETPHDGDVGAFLVDGEFLVKQFCSDNFNNIYLFSLNRDRADADRILWSHEEHTLTCFGRVIMKKRIPLPEY